MTWYTLPQLDHKYSMRMTTGDSIFYLEVNGLDLIFIWMRSNPTTRCLDTILLSDQAAAVVVKGFKIQYFLTFRVTEVANVRQAYIQMLFYLGLFSKFNKFHKLVLSILAAQRSYIGLYNIRVSECILFNTETLDIKKRLIVLSTEYEPWSRQYHETRDSSHTYSISKCQRKSPRFVKISSGKYRACY